MAFYFLVNTADVRHLHSGTAFIFKCAVMFAWKVRQSIKATIKEKSIYENKVVKV